MINGISFILSAIMEYFIDNNYNTKRINSKLFANIIEGVQYVSKDKVVLGFILNMALTNICFAIFNLAIPIYTSRELNKPEYYSIMLSAESLGAIMIMFVVLKRNFTHSRRNLIILKTAVASMILVFSSFSIHVSVILMFLLGFTQALYSSTLFSFIQARCEKEYLGRVLSLVYMGGLSVTPITYIISGLAIDRIIVNSFLYIGILLFFLVYHLYRVISQDTIRVNGLR